MASPDLRSDPRDFLLCLAAGCSWGAGSSRKEASAPPPKHEKESERARGQGYRKDRSSGSMSGISEIIKYHARRTASTEIQLVKPSTSFEGPVCKKARKQTTTAGCQHRAGRSSFASCCARLCIDRCFLIQTESNRCTHSGTRKNSEDERT